MYYSLLQPRSDEKLGGCLTIQALQCGSTSNSSSQNITSDQKPAKHKPIKSEKNTRALMQNVLSVGKMVQCHNDILLNQRLGQQHAIPQYMMGGHYPQLDLGPTSPGGMMASPLSMSDQCTPTVIQSQAPLPHQNYDQSSKGSTILPTYTSALSSSNNFYTADPASPMQTTLLHMRSNGFPPEGANTMTVPSHPPPNYTEATGRSLLTHLPPNYNSIMLYPSHTATLPTINHH